MSGYQFDWSIRRRPWDDDEFEVSTDDLLNGLEHPQVTHDEKLQIREILLHGGSRKAELTAFVITGLDRMPSDAQAELRALDISNDVAVDALARKHGTTSDIVRRWYDTLVASSSDSQSQSLVNQASLDSSWTPSSDHEGDQSSVQLQASAVPTALVVATIMASGRRALSRDGTTVQERRQQEERWKHEWDLHESEWNLHHRKAFPALECEQAQWSRAACADGATILRWLQNSEAPHYVLNRLREPVLVDITNQLRLEVIDQELDQLRLTLANEQRRERVADWQARVQASQSQVHRMASLNDKDQWTFLNAMEYGNRPVLRLCAPRRRAYLSRWIICALVYQDEIAEPLRIDRGDRRTVSERITAVGKLLRESKSVAAAF